MIILVIKSDKSRNYYDCIHINDKLYTFILSPITQHRYTCLK